MYSTNAEYRFVGWNQTIQNNPTVQLLFDKNRLQLLQQEITRLLQGVGTEARPIIVPIDTISHVLYQCFATHKPRVGDIYSRYVQAENSLTRDDVVSIQNRAVNIIVSQIRNEFETIDNNRKLSIWTTVYGDFNTSGLRAHAPIKTRNKRPETMQIHMRY